MTMDNELYQLAQAQHEVLRAAEADIAKNEHIIGYSARVTDMISKLRLLMHAVKDVIEAPAEKLDDGMKNMTAIYHALDGQNVNLPAKSSTVLKPDIEVKI